MHSNGYIYNGSSYANNPYFSGYNTTGSLALPPEKPVRVRHHTWWQYNQELLKYAMDEVIEVRIVRGTTVFDQYEQSFKTEIFVYLDYGKYSKYISSGTKREILE